MTKKQLIEDTRKALQAFAALLPDEQIRRMIAHGTINEKGEVLLERNPPGAKDAPTSDASSVPSAGV